MPSNL